LFPLVRCCIAAAGLEAACTRLVFAEGQPVPSCCAANKAGAQKVEPCANGKAAPLFDRSVRPYLIDQKTGAKFIVPDPPKVGSLRVRGNPKADTNYFVFFANPGGYVKPGSKVTVVIGDFQAKDLVVEKSTPDNSPKSPEPVKKGSP